MPDDFSNDNTIPDAPPQPIGGGAPDEGNNGDVSIPPIIHPGDHRNPDDPRLPLVSPVVDGGNL